MAIIDSPQKPSNSESAAEAAYEIRNLVRNQGGFTISQVDKIKTIVANHSRTAISAELGADAADMLTIYNAMKSLAKLINAEFIEEDLPA